jgi:hypothetical protein
MICGLVLCDDPLNGKGVEDLPNSLRVVDFEKLNDGVGYLLDGVLTAPEPLCLGLTDFYVARDINRRRRGITRFYVARTIKSVG